MVSMARPPVYDDALRQRLLDVTAEHVARRGLEAVSLRELAQAADTSTSAIYTLFGGKAALFAAVIESGFQSLADSQEARATDGLEALGRAYREWAISHPELYRLMFIGSAPPVIDDDCEPELPPSLLPLRGAVAARLPDADERVLAARVIATWAQVHGAVSLELSGVVPDIVPADRVYDAVLSSISAALPVPTPA